MKKYELMVIIDNDLSEKDAAKYAKDVVLGKIKELGGTVTFEDFWGARGFAYMINKKKFGYYFVCQFELEGDKTLTIRKDFNLEKSIVRHLLTSVDPRDPAPKTYAEMQKEVEAREREKKIAEGEKAPKSTVKKSTPKAEEKKEAPVKDKKLSEEKKDEVSKKLDSIMEDASADL